VSWLVSKTGLELTRQVTRSEVRALIAALRPNRTNIDLIRLGPESDGGYLLPDDLSGIGAVFSPGVGGQSGFEFDLAERGFDVFLADASVDQPAQDHPRFHFTRKHLDVRSTRLTMTLDEWKSDCIGDSTVDLLLQMDIEGAEYTVLRAVSDQLLAQFRILVVEFHSLHRVWSRPWFDVASDALLRLLETHAVVHIHPNNGWGSLNHRGIEIPRIAEFTLLRRDRVKSSVPADDFPHHLDRPNTEGALLPLPKTWYGG